MEISSIQSLKAETWIMCEVWCRQCQRIQLEFHPVGADQPFECGYCHAMAAESNLQKSVMVTLYQVSDLYWFAIQDEFDQVIGTPTNDIYSAAGKFLERLREY